MTLSELINTPEGFVPPQITGKLKAIYPQKAGGEGDKAWKLQSGVITDGTTEVRVVFSGRDSVSEDLRGQEVYAVARNGDRGLYGLKRKDDTYQGTTRNEVWIYSGADLSFGDAPNTNGQEQAVQAPVQETAQDQHPVAQTAQPAQTASSSADLKAEADTYGGDAQVAHVQREIQQAVNLMQLCLDGANFVRANNAEMTDDQFQAITSTLFINSDKRGLVSKMPVAPLKGTENDGVPF